MSSGSRSTHSYRYLVFIDGRRTVTHIGDPLAAIEATTRAMEADPEQSVVIVVLDAEEASYSAEMVAARPFMVGADVQAAEAVLAAETERLADSSLGSRASAVEARVTGMPAQREPGCLPRSVSAPDAALVGGEPRDPATNGDVIRALADDADRLPSPPTNAESRDKPSRSHLLAGSATCSDEGKGT